MKHQLIAATLVIGLSTIVSQAASAAANVASGASADAGQLQPGEHDVILNGLSFHYTVSGQGPLLVVQAPGWGIGSAYLRNGLAPLTQHFTVLTYDPRGSGQSSHAVDYRLLS